MEEPKLVQVMQQNGQGQNCGLPGLPSSMFVKLPRKTLRGSQTEQLQISGVVLDTRFDDPNIGAGSHASMSSISLDRDEIMGAGFLSLILFFFLSRRIMAGTLGRCAAWRHGFLAQRGDATPLNR